MKRALLLLAFGAAAYGQSPTFQALSNLLNPCFTTGGVNFLKIVVYQGPAGSPPICALLNGSLSASNPPVLTIGGTGGTLPNLANNEVPAGTVDGNNLVFTLAHPPLANSLNLFRNGVHQQAPAPDYTITGNTITFAAGAVPRPGDLLVAAYWF